MSLRVIDPCKASWDAMEARAGGKHCATCDQHVFDLRHRTEAEAHALALLFGRDGFCARARTDDDGFAVFRTRLLSPKRVAVTWTALTASACGASDAPIEHPAHEGCVTEVEIVAAPAMPRSVSTQNTSDTPAVPRTVSSASTAAADADGDGVPDDVDKCPDSAGFGNAGGCPKVIVVSSGGMHIIQQPLFMSGSAKILPSSIAILDETAKLILASPQLTNILIEGHADGLEKNPIATSAARADAVLKYLLKKGVDPKVLSSVGRGTSQPMAPNTPNAPPDDLARNRRVSFQILP
jgi:outer membrane protein OmpA-like peptidoglycan-associated protein